MPITPQELDHIAKLAHLAISDDDKTKLAQQLDDILAYANKLNSIDTSDVEPTAHAIPQPTVFREDEPIVFGNRAQLLANAPDAENGFFAVPKI